MDLDDVIKSREGAEIGSESREKGDLLPCSSPLRMVDVTCPAHNKICDKESEK